MKPNISLIIPVYNVEDYLEKCLDSVVFQTMPFYEVILIDDGSTDRSADVCRKYISEYSYFSLITQENKGQSAARNVGIEHASGDYLMFLDSDDWLRKDSVQILSEILMQVSLDAVYFDAHAFSELDNGEIPDNNYDRCQAELDGKLMSGREYFVRSYPRDYIVAVWAGIYKRERVEKSKIRFPEGIYYEDNYFTFVFLTRAQKCIHISEKLYQRRFRPYSTMTGTYSEKKFNDYVECVCLIWEYILIMDIWEDRKALREFIHEHCNIILCNYQYCSENNLKLGNDSIGLLSNVLEKYFYILNYLKDGMEEKELGNLVRLWKNVTKIGICKLKEEAYLNKIKKNVAVNKKMLYIELLNKLPMNNQRMKIGIYGKGKHTEGLIAIYKQLIGEIKCDLSFIVSAGDEKRYKGRKVINYQEIDNKFDMIIVSSFLYEREMLENIRSVNKTISVFCFYNEISTDIFSDYFNLGF